MMPSPIRKESFGFTILLGFLAALPSISIDINAPSLLLVQQQLGSRSGTVGLTVTLFMLGFGLGQLGAGPISDRWGRRPVLMAGLVVYGLTAFGCAVSGSVPALIGWRLFQGLGAGACSVLAFTMIHDLFDGDAARSKRSYVTVVFGLAPMLAPSLGAWVLDLAGWRLIHVVLACWGLALWAAVAWGVSESQAVSHRQHRPVSIKAAYRKILRNRRFVELAAVNALSFGGMFAYIAGSSLVLMGTFNLSGTSYGFAFAGTAAALTAGAWVSGRCASAGFDSYRLMTMSLMAALISASALLVLLLGDKTSLWLILPALMANLFCRGIIAPSAQHLALEPIQEDAGSATAAVGVMQILMGAVSSAFVTALLPGFGALGMAAVMTTLAFVSLVLWLWALRPPQHGSASSDGVLAEPTV